jgi:hypothetical protein
VPGALLPALSGERIDGLAAYAVTPGGSGAPAPIPFQVDERDREGRYVMDRYAATAGKADRASDDGRMDANDEAVFEASDAGARAAASALPAHGAGQEIEIALPGSGEKRYVYLLAVKSPPRSPRDDVRYEASGAGRVDSRHYALAFGENPTILSALRIKAAAGGNGENLLRGSRHKLYSRLTPYLLSLRIKRDEKDVRASVIGTRDGPVRVVRLVKKATPLLLGLSTPETVRTELYGAADAEWRDEVGFSLDMKRLVARSVIEERLLLSRAAAGSTFLCEGGGRATIGEGGGGDLPLGKARWFGVAGEAGAFYVRYGLAGKGDQKVLFENGGEGAGGWQLDVVSMDGRILPLVTRFAFPAAAIASDPARVPGLGAAAPPLAARALGDAVPRMGPGGPARARTLARRYDPVVITGAHLKPFLGEAAGSLRLYAAREGRLRPVAFQIDERDADGRYVLPQGAAATADVDRGRLDDNDEVVTMADRAGDRADRAAWPDGATRGAEIEVSDPHGSAWLYLFAFASPPPISNERLVRREGFDRIVTDVFSVAFPKRKAYFDQFRMKTAASGRMSENLVDHLKIRFRLTFSFLYIPLPYRAGEDDFGRETVAYREGPVRMILRQDLWANLTFGVVFHLEPSDWVFYENQAVSEVLVKNPFLYGEGALKRIKGAHFVQTVDLDRAASGLRFYNSENPKGVDIDGRMSGPEKNLVKRKDRWIVVSGRQAHSVARVLFSEGIDPDRDLYYVDDRNRKDWNDRDYGQWGNSGYDVNLKAKGSVILLTAPMYKIILYFYLPPDFDVARRQEILDILDRPIRVERRD